MQGNSASIQQQSDHQCSLRCQTSQLNRKNRWIKVVFQDIWLTKLPGSGGSLAGKDKQPGMPNELRNAIKMLSKRDNTKGTAWAPLPVALLPWALRSSSTSPW